MNGQNNTNIYWNHLIIFSVTIFNIYFAFIVLLILTVDCWSVLQITDCVQGKTLINSLNPLQHCLQRWRWSPPAWWVGYGSTKAKYKKRQDKQFWVLHTGPVSSLLSVKGAAAYNMIVMMLLSFLHRWPGWDIGPKWLSEKYFDVYRPLCTAAEVLTWAPECWCCDGACIVCCIA